MSCSEWIPFRQLSQEYEKNKDLCKFCDLYKDHDNATRFLLIRSLDKENLKDIIRLYSSESLSGTISVLMEKAYDSSASVSQIVSYIENQRDKLLTKREEELNGMSDILSDFPIKNCGIRNDKVDDIIKAFVRNKHLKSCDALYRELDDSVLPRIRQYCLWSYYNQSTNDIIELSFLKHPLVLPTLRKIHDIDFFLKIDDNLIPFDLKITHISDSYFNAASQGLLQNSSDVVWDSFWIAPDASNNEEKILRSYYNSRKKELHFTSISNLKYAGKDALCACLLNSGDPEAAKFVHDLKQRHQNYVPASLDSLFPLEWWNYKDQ